MHRAFQQTQLPPALFPPACLMSPAVLSLFGHTAPPDTAQPLTWLVKARLVTLLREPVSRAISHINMETQRKVLPPSVERALGAAPTNHTAHVNQLVSDRQERLLRYAALTLTQ